MLVPCVGAKLLDGFLFCFQPYSEDVDSLFVLNIISAIWPFDQVCAFVLIKVLDRALLGAQVISRQVAYLVVRLQEVGVIYVILRLLYILPVPHIPVVLLSHFLNFLVLFIHRELILRFV